MAQFSEGVRIAANGRMVLPIAIRRVLGIKGDSKVFVSVENGEVKLRSVSDNVRCAQELYRKYVKVDQTVDDFLRDRREEALRDDA